MFKRLTPHEFALQIAAAASWGLAVCSILFAYAYASDIAAILASPAQIWGFVCGIPLQSNSTIPVLVGTGIFGICSGSVLLYIRQRAITA